VERHVHKLLILLTLLTVGLACYGIYEFSTSFPVRGDAFPLCAAADTTDPDEMNLCQVGIPRWSDANITNSTAFPCGTTITNGDICGCHRVAAAIEVERKDPNNVFAVLLALMLLDLVSVVIFAISLVIDWRAKTVTFWRACQPRFECAKLGTEIVFLPIAILLTILVISFSLTVVADGFTVKRYIVVDTGKNPSGQSRGQIDGVDVDATPADIATFERATLTDCIGAEEVTNCEEYEFYSLFVPEEVTEKNEDPEARIAVGKRIARVDCDENKDFYVTVKKNLNEGVGVCVGVLLLEFSLLLLDGVFVRHRRKKRAAAARRVRKNLKRKARGLPPLGSDESSSSSASSVPDADSRHVFSWGDSEDSLDDKQMVVELTS
jgi:hypothetical protein